jgi:hypothetical protein
VAVNAASAAIISTAGFSTGGVVAGSIAAGTHAGIGSVAAGSIFAGLQSLGALGMGILGTTVFPVAAGAGIIFGSIPLIKKWWPKKWSKSSEMFEGDEWWDVVYVFSFLSLKVKIESTNTKIKTLILILLVGRLFGWMVVLRNVLGFFEWRVWQLLVGLLARLWEICGLI